MKASSNSKLLCQTTHTISNAIDHLLNKGAQKLYDKYIAAKIPQHLSSKLQTIITDMFDPLTNTNQQQNLRKQQKVHESIIEKINLSKEAKSSRVCSREERDSKIFQSRLSGLKQARQGGRERQQKTGEKSSEAKPQTQSKQSSNSGLKRLINKNLDVNESLQLIRMDKAKRYEEEKQKAIESQRLFQRSQRHRQQLEYQLKTLQQSGRIIPFDYETGTGTFVKSEPSRYQHKKVHKSNNHLIHLNCRFQEQRSRPKPKIPEQRQISNVRKITTFERARKSKQRQLDNQNYNNNGQRQSSTIPYLQIEEGVKIVETTGNRVAERPQTSRKPGTASTHRTFKSYTRERLQSIGTFKTIDVAASAGNTRYLGLESKESKRTTHQTPKRSLVWSSRSCPKDHRINKNIQHFAEFFDCPGQTIE